MKIIQLTAENVKKLTAVQISPDGALVQITGKNGQGKTSVLDSIWWALAGTATVQKQPIRKGADSARIEIKLGSGKAVELIVERRFTDSASYLTVKTAEGAKYPSPQRLLDDLLGALTFDPLAFMQQDGRGQFDVLRGLVKLDVDLDAQDKANVADFATRTLVNREAKTARAQASGIAVAPDLPAEPIDEASLIDEIQTAATTNTQIEQRKAARVQAERDMGDALAIASDMRDAAAKIIADAETQARQVIASAKKQADTALARAVEVDTKASDLKKRLAEAPKLPDQIDIAGLRAKLNDAKEINLKISSREHRTKIEERAAELEARAAALGEAIDARKAERKAAMESAQMPIDGLSFGDGTVLFRELPLDQASDADQLMVSTAIAAALNPKLRVLRIRNGSLLDDDAMVRLADFAKERDFQIWIERVDGSGTVGIVMEDGHVKGQEPLQAEAAA